MKTSVKHLSPLPRAHHSSHLAKGLVGATRHSEDFNSDVDKKTRTGSHILLSCALLVVRIEAC